MDFQWLDTELPRGYGGYVPLVDCLQILNKLPHGTCSYIEIDSCRSYMFPPILAIPDHTDIYRHIKWQCSNVSCQLVITSEVPSCLILGLPCTFHGRLIRPRNRNESVDRGPGCCFSTCQPSGPQNRSR